MSDNINVTRQSISSYGSKQYDGDLKFIEKIDKRASPRLVFMLYFCPLVACLFAHTLYMILFAMSDVVEMVIFNVFSVLFYAVMIILARSVKEKLNLIYASQGEIIAHAVTATVFVGLMPNFCMFLLMIIPLAFLMPNKHKWVPFIIMLTSVPLYGFLNFYYSTSGHAIHDLSNTQFQPIFYVINIIVGSFVLIYVATIFTILHSYTEAKIRVQNEQLKIMASTDPLTKLSNRREINRRLAEIYKKCTEKGQSFIVGIGDIDNFKNVNDTYGHDMGDVVLASVAEIIGKNLPDDSCASRWGGEEFLFVLPDSGIEEGKAYADRVIEQISKQVHKHGNNEFTVTMTIGICLGTADCNIDSIISCADARLYKGKHNGKNHAEYSD